MEREVESFGNIPEHQRYIREQLLEFAAREEFPIAFKGESVQLIIFGETKQTHRPKQQAELARNIVPGYIVLQGLGDFIFNPLTHEFRPNPMYDLNPGFTEYVTALKRLTTGPPTTPNGYSPFLEVSNELSIPLMGCDVPQSEIIAHIFPQYPKFVLSNHMDNDKSLRKAIRGSTKRYQSLYIERFLTLLPKNPLHPVMAVIKEPIQRELYKKNNLDNYCMIAQIPRSQ